MCGVRGEKGGAVIGLLCVCVCVREKQVKLYVRREVREWHLCMDEVMFCVCVREREKQVKLYVGCMVGGKRMGFVHG